MAISLKKLETDEAVEDTTSIDINAANDEQQQRSVHCTDLQGCKSWIVSRVKLTTKMQIKQGDFGATFGEMHANIGRILNG